MTMQTIQVPDIGDFKDIPVIEILVKAGDEIVKEQALLILESDKATMEVPSDVMGKVVSVDIKIGDKVSFGTPFMTVEVSADMPVKKAAVPVATSVATPVPQPTLATTKAPTAGSYSGTANYSCQLLV